MSRSGYSDDYDEDGTGGLWRGAVARAIKGKRGQAFLRETLAALDAMPEKCLAAESLVTTEGEFCTFGVTGAARGIDMTPIDPEDWHAVAKAFGVAPALVRELVYENDEGIDQWAWVDAPIVGPVRPYYPEYGRHTVRRRVSVERIGEKRWAHMRAWVARQLIEPAPDSAALPLGARS